MCALAAAAIRDFFFGDWYSCPPLFAHVTYWIQFFFTVITVFLHLSFFFLLLLFATYLWKSIFQNYISIRMCLPPHHYYGNWFRISNIKRKKEEKDENGMVFLQYSHRRSFARSLILFHWIKTENKHYTRERKRAFINNKNVEEMRKKKTKKRTNKHITSWEWCTLGCGGHTVHNFFIKKIYENMKIWNSTISQEE